MITTSPYLRAGGELALVSVVVEVRDEEARLRLVAAPPDDVRATLALPRLLVAHVVQGATRVAVAVLAALGIVPESVVLILGSRYRSAAARGLFSCAEPPGVTMSWQSVKIQGQVCKADSFSCEQRSSDGSLQQSFETKFRSQNSC